MNFTARVTSRALEAGRAPSILRSVRIAALGLASVALTALFVFPASLPAAAEPPLTVAEARALIEQLETDAAAHRPAVRRRQGADQAGPGAIEAEAG